MKKAQFFQYTIELLIVMAGVFMGMLLSDWNSNRNQEKLRQAVLVNMVAEIEQNQAELKKAVEYHRTLMTMMDSLWQHTGKEALGKPFIDGHGFAQIPHWRGLGVKNLGNSVYEAALLSNIFPGMKPALLERISQTYKMISSYNAIGEKLLDRLLGITAETKYMDVLLTIEIIREDILGFEQVLLRECQQTIDAIKTQQ